MSLADGTVLLFGSTVERYDPDTGAWSSAGTLQGGQAPSGATTLASGLVLVTGGTLGTTSITTAAQLYDPVTGTSTFTAPMQFARVAYQATRLTSGKVLVSGGRDANSKPVGVAEIYDPGTGRWSPTGALNVPRFSHVAVGLASGGVLVAGGYDGEFLASAEIYDPGTGRWTFTTPMDRARIDFDGAVLPDGHVLVAGYSAGELGSQVYDPAAGTWASSKPVAPVETFFLYPPFLTILRDGTPLVVFGNCFRGCIFVSALLDVPAGVWTPPSAVPTTSATFGLTVLPDGRALLAGRGGASALFRPDNGTPRLDVSPAAVQLRTPIPRTPIQTSLTLQNTGEQALFGSVTTAPPLSIVSGGTFTLQPGDTATLVVELAPAPVGIQTGTLRFMSNGNWPSVSVTGVTGVRLGGRITEVTGAGVRAETVDLTGASVASKQTDVSGRYEFLVAPNSTYTVTPRSLVFYFNPEAFEVSLGTVDRGDLEFVAQQDGLRDFVSRLYSNVLRRAVDLPGWNGWRTFLRHHCDSEGFAAIAAAFYDSGELRAQPVILVELATLMYRGMLEREPDPAGLAGWVSVLRQARLNLATQRFLGSPEFHRQLPARTDRDGLAALVMRLYVNFLGRPARPDEVAAWVDDLAARGDYGGTVLAFLSSPEFERRGMTFRGYVTILYGTLFGRAPDADELDVGEAVPRAALLAALNDGFVLSPEAQAHMAKICGT